MLLPYILSTFVIGYVAVFLFQTFVLESPYYGLLVGNNTVVDGEGTDTVTGEEGYLPPIAYGSQWATLNVDGWKKRDIRVYFGDDNKILSKGAGMWINSRFCGQNGKIVISAHVTTDFYEIESTPIGTQLTMDTVYGKYVYKVVDSEIFDYRDGSLLMPKDGEEVLILYTCYPRKNGYQFKSKRMALICKKLEGKEWPTYG